MKVTLEFVIRDDKGNILGQNSPFSLEKENQQKEVEKSKTRLIKEGGGNKPKLSEEEQIILMLVYLRHYLSFQLLGIMFKISESSAHNIFNYWQSLFEGNLPASLFEQVKKHPEEMEKIKEELIQHELIIDATEQAVLATFRAG
jgi:hypothetical protein